MVLYRIYETVVNDIVSRTSSVYVEQIFDAIADIVVVNFPGQLLCVFTLICIHRFIYMYLSWNVTLHL